MKHLFAALTPLFLPLTAAFAAFGALPEAAPGVTSDRPAPDQFVVTLDANARTEPADGRVVLFFITETGGGWARRRPIDGPFFSAPQPIASVAVSGLQPGGQVVIDGEAVAYPRSIDHLSGPVRVQAILVADQTERSRLEGPGNVFSDIVGVTLDPGISDRVELTLRHRVEGPREPQPAENLVWVRLRSELLSAHAGRDVYHRAGVALPAAYAENESERWPAIYIIPGYGGRDLMAGGYANRLRAPGAAEQMPRAVHIVLDPESPLGHHGFTDTDNHGPRGTALVKELIPYLESRFRLDARSDMRLVTGHSSGGWTSLWLQLQWPEIFGGCWSSAPDPVCFTAFQMSDIYRDESMYHAPDGSEQPSYRVPTGEGATDVRMTVRQECLMEYAIHPLGGSGEQWDAWEAMFSPLDPETGYPKRMFDRQSGAINREIVDASWAAFDMTRLIDREWERLGPVVLNRVRLFCGDLDNYYLERAVERFGAVVERRRGEATGHGYVEILPGETHSTITRRMMRRIAEEMQAHIDRVSTGTQN